jgi:elongation factor G
MKISRAIFINHIDREDADFDLAMATLHARYGSRLGAVTIPIGVGNDFKGIIDVLRMQARYYEDGKERVEEIPAE